MSGTQEYIERLNHLRTVLESRSIGGQEFTKMLLNCDKAVMQALRSSGHASDYKVLTDAHPPTHHGFKQNLIQVISGRLEFLTTLDIHLPGSPHAKIPAAGSPNP